MITAIVPHRHSRAPSVRGLVAAAHPGPAVAVVVLTALLGFAEGLAPARLTQLLVVVLTGQLCVGWSNDLIDRERDERVGRTDKPLVTGATTARAVLVADIAAAIGCVVLSLSLGAAAGVLHLACVGSALAYNAGLKGTAWSWTPYALSFGGGTAVVTLAHGTVPPWWWPVGAALLGVGAHLLNVLPDLADDAATGIRGLPHRLGERLLAPVAAAVLLAATAVVLLGAGPPLTVTIAASVAALVLALIVVLGSGHAPFVAAVLIAVGDALLLVLMR